MRRPLQLKSAYRSRRKVTRQTSVPAATGGWNARDPIANMDPKDAIRMENLWPTAADVMLRKGWDGHVTGISGQVESLMPYLAPDGSDKLFGAAGTDFYDVTTAGSVGAAVVSALTNARWNDVLFTTSANTFLVACNGEDSIRYFDGTNWITIDAVSTPAITGVTTADLIYPAAHKNRLWFVEKDSLNAWYLPADAVGGAATNFPLAGVASRGGSLRAIGTWTLDAGEGVDDHWVAVTSEGQVIVYKGTDPASPSTWGLVGVWNLGQPLSLRPLLKWGGDLLLALKEGVYPLAKALVSAELNPQVALTDRIREAMSEAATRYSSNFGWQMLHYPSADMLLLNVPVAEGSGQEQYAMNTITGRWGRFKNIEANCWAIFQGEPYFGGNGVVGKFWGTFDDDGNNIEGDLKQAFNYFGARGVLKDFKDMRPIFAADGSPSILTGLNLDYADDDPTGTLAFTPTIYGLWDSALWDSGIWGGGLSPFAEWQGGAGIGTCAALRIKIAAQGIEVRHQATDYLYETGGVIG